jgi:hypothetical protein
VGARVLRMSCETKRRQAHSNRLSVYSTAIAMFRHRDGKDVGTRLVEEGAGGFCQAASLPGNHSPCVFWVQSRSTILIQPQSSLFQPHPSRTTSIVSNNTDRIADMAAVAPSAFSTSTSSLRASQSQNAAPFSYADSPLTQLPAVDIPFDDLRRRMAEFTIKFDAFIERGRKRVLEERNEFKAKLSELNGKQIPHPYTGRKY